jgi:hypothetical protein
VPNERYSDFSLFLDILHTLEAIGAPYVVIGAFAATVYGSTRTTHDIDIIVDLSDEHVVALVAAYPSPRYYADPEQMRDSIRRGIMFNIIDADRGEKADLVPLSMDPRYRRTIANRVRQKISVSGIKPFEIWCARPEDVIVGKLMAWDEGRSNKHESDILQMMVLHYRGPESGSFEEIYIDEQARLLGPQVAALWEAIKQAARREAGPDRP